MIKYLGSKRTLLSTLISTLDTFPELRSVFDAFSGTSRCGHAFKGHGLRVVANDHNAYAHTLATCYVEADLDDVLKPATQLLKEFQRLPGKAGYFTDQFCERRASSSLTTALEWTLSAGYRDQGPARPLRSVVVSSLMEGANASSTCGVRWPTSSVGQSALRDLEPACRMFSPRLTRPVRCTSGNVLDAATQIQADVAYRSATTNIVTSLLSHLESWLVRWPRHTASPTNASTAVSARATSTQASTQGHLRVPPGALDAKLWLVSFSDEAISRSDLVEMLSAYGEVHVISRDFRRYIGAQIGIHNPKGERVGEVSHVRNQEYIYVVVTPALMERVPDAVSRLEQLAPLTNA